MRLRQLPQLYLRGSIANETMKHLPQAQREQIDCLTREISNHHLLAGHKHRFVEKLSQTIGGDYKNPVAAEQEYSIAIWRALIYLMHHTDYSYRCTGCKAVEYYTRHGKAKAFDRRYPICPACGAVKIASANGAPFKNGQCIKMDDLQKAIKNSRSKRTPSHTSPIVSIKGARKVADHQVVLSDPHQLVKYFSEFIWNYLRQTLRENEIKFHNKEPKLVFGPADQIGLEEVRSMLVQHKVPFTYQKSANPYDGFYHIAVEMMITNQVVSRALRVLIDKYREYGVSIVTTDTEVMVSVTLTAPNIEAMVVAPQQVYMQTKDAQKDSDASVFDVYHQNIIPTGGSAMQEDGIAKVETDDLIGTVRESLNNGAQQVFDILMGNGDAYHKFTDFQRSPKGLTNGQTEEPRPTHIARFLGTSARQVKMWIKDIQVQCLAHGVGS